MSSAIAIDTPEAVSVPNAERLRWAAEYARMAADLVEEVRSPEQWNDAATTVRQLREVAEDVDGWAGSEAAYQQARGARA